MVTTKTSSDRTPTPSAPPNLFERLRVWFSLRLFTPLQGMGLSAWFRELLRNRFAIAPKFLPRAALITVSSPVNSAYAWVDRRRFDREIERQEVREPIFVLGHWRSGTTLLHQLLVLDDRFGFPNFYQVVFPRGFLTSERTNSRVWSGALPETRIFDNMEYGFHAPAEDEFALSTMSGLSPYMGWNFPRRQAFYDRFLTFRDANQDERERWSRTIGWYFRKLTLRYGGRPLVLKSPPHTARIRLLLEAFPDAKFVHIHRHPHAVFPSTKKMLSIFLRTTQLQSFDESGLEDRVVRVYRELHDAFFEERRLIPEDRFHEVSYDQLESDPLGTMRDIYERLRLPDFEIALPAIRRHLESIAGYRRNRFDDLPDALRSRLAREWATCFDAWGYAR